MDDDPPFQVQASEREPAVRSEQEDLIRQFVREHGQQLIELAARMVGRASAEDVAQEAFVRLAKRIERSPLPEVMRLLRSPPDLRKLMFRITACRAYDHLRREYGRAGQRAGPDELERALDEASMERSQRDLGLDVSVDAVERAYRALPPMQRLAHVLHHYYGLTDSELAAALETSPSNSRSLVCRATRALRRAMEMDP
jgi:RNA polymerase sigma factor (sigma-70 family)